MSSLPDMDVEQLKADIKELKEEVAWLKRTFMSISAFLEKKGFKEEAATAPAAETAPPRLDVEAAASRARLFSNHRGVLAFAFAQTIRIIKKRRRNWMTTRR